MLERARRICVTKVHVAACRGPSTSNRLTYQTTGVHYLGRLLEAKFALFAMIVGLPYKSGREILRVMARFYLSKV